MTFFTGIYSCGVACSVSPAPPSNDLRRHALLAGQINTYSESLLPPVKWFQRIGTARPMCKSLAKPVNTGSVHDGTSGPRCRAKEVHMRAWVRAYTRGFQHLVFKLGTWDSWTERKKTNVLGGF